MNAPRPPRAEQRLAARTRPDGPAAMFQTWRHLLFLHWEADPAELSSRLPHGLHLDLFEGRAYLGIVPFFMQGVRPRGLPAVRALSDFRELNVRTYVHDDHGRPGVWFFSLDASNGIACAIARARFHLPYFKADIRAHVDGWIDYACARRGSTGRAEFRYQGRGQSQAAEPGTLSFFLIERYDLFAHNGTQLFRGSVHHAPYLLEDAEVERWSVKPAKWDGLPIPDTRPAHTCYAQEARVEVFRIEPVLPAEA